MRKYEKPQMQVERYQAKNAVAYGCTPETVTEFPAQEVDCIINGKENIFNSSQYGCIDDVQSGAVGTYGSSYIYVWYDGSSAAQPTPEQTAVLSAMEEAVGWHNAVNKHGYHAGYISAEQYERMNSNS